MSGKDDNEAFTPDEKRRLRDLMIEQDCILAIKNYSFGIDLGDREMLLEAFHEDAIIQMGPTWIMTGHAEIGRMIDISSRWADKHHISTDHKVTVESSTVARGLCHGIALYVSPDLVHISGTARYRDRFLIALVGSAVRTKKPGTGHQSLAVGVSPR